MKTIKNMKIGDDEFINILKKSYLNQSSNKELRRCLEKQQTRFFKELITFQFDVHITIDEVLSELRKRKLETLLKNEEFIKKSNK